MPPMKLPGGGTNIYCKKGTLYEGPGKTIHAAFISGFVCEHALEERGPLSRSRFQTWLTSGRITPSGEPTTMQ